MSFAGADVVIGLEVHCELDTRTKLFCSCPSQASEDEGPNSRCCPVCLGHPGSKPLTNRRAVEYALRLALALDCAIAPALRFSRKSYFYPDLPKNFQITQYEHPLGAGGRLALPDGKAIGITRAHLEEDPGAITDYKEFSLIDYNRSGSPLVEVVTEPDLRSSQEARDFVGELVTLLECLRVFNQERNVVRVDANVSVRESGYVRVELKNILGQRELFRALTYEIARQRKACREGHAIVRETRGWNASIGATFTQRSKETEEDYGYIEEPDLVPIPLGKGWVGAVRKALPELPQQRAKRFVNEYKLAADDAGIIASDRVLADAFEALAGNVQAVLAGRWLRREVLRILNLAGLRSSALESQLAKGKPLLKELAALLTLVEKKTITENNAKGLLEQLLSAPDKPLGVRGYVKEHGLEALAGKGAADELRTACERAISENPKAVADYRKGREEALDYLLGQVMRLTKARAEPGETKALLKRLLS